MPDPPAPMRERAKGILQRFGAELKSARHKGSFARNAFYTSSDALVTILAQVILTPLVARIYGPEAYGIYGLFMSITMNLSTIGGLAYNMRVMRANLLDTLNAQYVETARAKGLSEGAVIMKHAVPNALHPLVAYQGVVLPYMLTGEIEVAIVFGLATIGPAIVQSMGIGDVYVTATLLLVLGATLIVGNIIADLLLVALDPRIRVGADT